MTPPGTCASLLSGVVGSTAHGLAGPDSDVDRLGIFAAPTEWFHGLDCPAGDLRWETHVTNNPDSTWHEVGKFCRLALACNPAVLELLWLPRHLYETTTPAGEELIGMRGVFLSAGRVRGAYLEYAQQQFQRLMNRTGQPPSADTHHRTAKQARHLLRLCHQGYWLYRTGNLTVTVDDPQSLIDFGERVADGDTNLALRNLGHHVLLFDQTRSPLPDQPNKPLVEAWLRRVRHTHYTPPETTYL